MCEQRFFPHKLKYFGDFTLLFCRGMLERCTEFENARAVLLFCSLELLFCHRLVAVAVVFFSQGMFTFGAIVCQCLGFTHPHSQSIIFFFFFFHSSEVLEKTDTCKCASLNVSSVRLGHWILIADRIYVHGQKFVLGRLRVNIRSITVDPRSLEFPRETKMVRVSGGSR